MGHVTAFARVTLEINQLNRQITILKQQLYGFDMVHVPPYIVLSLEDANKKLQDEERKQSRYIDHINETVDRLRNVGTLNSIDPTLYDFLVSDNTINIDYIYRILSDTSHYSILFDINRTNFNDDEMLINYISYALSIRQKIIPIIVRMNEIHNDVDRFIKKSIINYTNKEFDNEDIEVIINESVGNELITLHFGFVIIFLIDFYKEYFDSDSEIKEFRTFMNKISKFMHEKMLRYVIIFKGDQDLGLGISPTIKMQRKQILSFGNQQGYGTEDSF